MQHSVQAAVLRAVFRSRRPIFPEQCSRCALLFRRFLSQLRRNVLVPGRAGQKSRRVTIGEFVGRDAECTTVPSACDIESLALGTRCARLHRVGDLHDDRYAAPRAEPQRIAIGATKRCRILRADPQRPNAPLRCQRNRGTPCCWSHRGARPRRERTGMPDPSAVDPARASAVPAATRAVQVMR